MSRLFAAEVLEFPESDAEKISALMGASDLQELKLLDQKARYKFDEIINFFTVFETHEEFREYFINHPKIKPFMDPNYCVTI